MKSRRSVAVASTVAALVAAMVPGLSSPAAVAETRPEAGPAVTDGCISSVPEPGTSEKVEICYTLFRPADASRTHRVPMVMHSHGWAGSRTTDAAAFRKWLDAGFGVLSFDQRGFGESGGKAHVEHPALEGRDVQGLIRLIAGLPWVRKDAPGDPRIGAIGGSYGGGYQYVGAFRNVMDKGKPVFDALAPEITWWDLNESLAPQEVVRTAWAVALSAAGSEALPPEVLVALAQGAATGFWPRGEVPGSADMVEFFRKNGPSWHVRNGRRLDIPVLMGQGATDSLFPLDQGLTNFRRALTRDARRQSIFVGYNGGHVLPAVFPQGVGVAGDPCSKKLGGASFEDLALRFFTENLEGRDTGLRGHGRYHLATAGAGCTTVRSTRADQSFEVGTVASTTAAGAPVAVRIADGPIRVAGTPYLSGMMTAAGVNNRAFYGLAVGTSPADARLVQNNVLPVFELEPVLGEERRIELPSVAVDVPEGESLFVMATPVSDVFVGMGSRTPGLILLEDATVHLPVVEE
ncbi:MAG TPA: CocE/NonD family hydrolase [Nocardioidaceae bacterium]|nr:CocE/NonD family hydrolase [Nocardioidaceae bacterium]